MRAFKHLLVIFLVSSMQAFAQDQMELNCSKQIFRTTQEKHFEKFSEGILILDKHKFKYNQDTLEIKCIDSTIMLLFEKGILYPGLIDGNSISNIEEISFGERSFTKKKFRMLVWSKNFLNPSLYFFELANYNATHETNFKAFILGSKLNILEFCSILI